jgi:hypothetical protein
MNPARVDPAQWVMAGQTEELDRGADAAKLCALVFLNGRLLDRFAVRSRDAAQQAGMPGLRFEEIVTWAVVSGWMRRRPSHIELTAAGIYVAKSYLDLPR